MKTTRPAEFTFHMIHLCYLNFVVFPRDRCLLLAATHRHNSRVHAVVGAYLAIILTANVNQRKIWDFGIGLCTAVVQLQKFTTMKLERLGILLRTLPTQS